MPELPEVEVTRREIAPWLVGRRIEEVITSKPSYFFLTPPAVLKRRLKATFVRQLTRRGKYLEGELETGYRLVLHLGMTGQLFAAGASSLRLLSSAARASLSPEAQVHFKPDRHTHLRLSFADGGPEIVFRDVRKFGKVLLLAPGESDIRLDKLGVDALEATGRDLYRAARTRRTPIKSLLLDQQVVAGIGNIYADEALFLSGVRPTRPAELVSERECEAIIDAAKRVMLRSIETGGSSISDYIRPGGQDGGYQDERKVYAREGESCTVCGKGIKRFVLGQRSAHFCPGCQR